MYCLLYRTDCNLDCAKLDPENCRHLGTLENVLRWAVLNSQSLNRYSFEDNVEVKHLDGSTYKFKSACFETLDKFLIVYPEHGHPCVFYIEDLVLFPK
jgi:hypothetical protein